MLRHPAAVDGKLYENTSSYSDLAFTDPGTLGQYAVRLWEAGALQLLMEPAQDYVDLFTVIKTDGPEGRRSRTVWDERRFNIRCTPPPKMPMGSPSVFSHWDLGRGRRRGDQMASVTGDLPDWGTRILAPPPLVNCFALKHLTVGQFLEALAAAGHPVPPGAERASAVALRVLLMGWSWAPFVAHTLMLAILEGALRPFRSRRLIEGLPAPPSAGLCPVHSGFIDDYGVALEAPQGPKLQELRRIQRAIRAALCKAGVIPHREKGGL